MSMDNLDNYICPTSAAVMPPSRPGLFLNAGGVPLAFLVTSTLSHVVGWCCVGAAHMAMTVSGGGHVWTHVGVPCCITP